MPPSRIASVPPLRRNSHANTSRSSRTPPSRRGSNTRRSPSDESSIASGPSTRSPSSISNNSNSSTPPLRNTPSSLPRSTTSSLLPSPSPSLRKTSTPSRSSCTRRARCPARRSTSTSSPHCSRPPMSRARARGHSTRRSGSSTPSSSPRTSPGCTLPLLRRCRCGASMACIWPSSCLLHRWMYDSGCKEWIFPGRCASTQLVHQLARSAHTPTCRPSGVGRHTRDVGAPSAAFRLCFPFSLASSLIRIVFPLVPARVRVSVFLDLCLLPPLLPFHFSFSCLLLDFVLLCSRAPLM
ncbi:hypothetical protein DFH09DRAFT_1157899 [Mycena vulgaris]|nr:hypothetical protein DFH09DRAFT_1157899 [Mycena vulgaris]